MKKTHTLTERERASELPFCVHAAGAAVALQHFRWSIASRRFYRSICVWMPPKRLTPRQLNSIDLFLSEMFRWMPCFTHTQNYAMHFMQNLDEYASPSGWLTASLARSHSHLVWQIFFRLVLSSFFFVSRKTETSKCNGRSHCHFAHRIPVGYCVASDQRPRIWCLASSLLRNKFRRCPNAHLSSAKAENRDLCVCVYVSPRIVAGKVKC